MCFSLNLLYLFRNIINLYYISPFSTCQHVHSVKRQLFNYILLCFIKLQILANISSFSLLRSQYNFCSGLRTRKFWEILLILPNISVLLSGTCRTWYYKIVLIIYLTRCATEAKSVLSESTLISPLFNL